jgi:hypothetical protein
MEAPALVGIKNLLHGFVLEILREIDGDVSVALIERAKQADDYTSPTHKRTPLF